MSDKIQVVIRLRPLNEREKQNGGDLAWQTRQKKLISPAEGANNQPYMFDRVYDCNDNTADIYHETVEPIICATMEGFNGTIFAYGQTSSGKTYTMSGTKEEKGIIPMAMTSMFDAINNAPNRQFLLRVSYMEIYNEKITDLLDTEEKTLKLLEDENRLVHVSGLKEMVFQNIDDMLAIKKKGDSRRRVAETARNEESSRSHAIFRMIIESQERTDNDDDLRDKSVRLSLLYFIDLAGSEKSSENSGDRFREGCAINKSLSVLGQVISKLSDGISHQHINYRDSKLTRLLQNGLGGNSKTAIICTINPTAIEETHSTLRFASRAKTINNQPMINEITDVSDKAILKRYQQEIQQLKKQLESYKKQTPQKNFNPYCKFISNDIEKEQLEKKYQNTIENLKKMICVSTCETTKQKNIRRKTWCPGLLKRKIEAPISDICGTPGRFLDSIAETSVSDDESKPNDNSNNNWKRISNEKPVNSVTCHVQTDFENENECFLRFENEMLKNMLALKDNEPCKPSPSKKPRFSVPDQNETREFLELELQCINDGIKLSVEGEKIEKEREKLKEEKADHDKEMKAFIDSKAELMQKVESTETENVYLLSKLQNSQERVKSLEEELQHAQRSSLLLDTSNCSNSGDRPLLNLSNITSRSASRSARRTDYNQLNDQIFNLESQVQILESQVQKLNQDLQMAREQILCKSEEITFLSSESNEQKLRLDKLNAENDKLQQIVQDKTPVFEHKEYIELRAQFDKVNQNNEKMNNELKLKAEELTYLSRKLVDQQDDKIPDISTSEESKTPVDNNDVLSEVQEQLAATIREKDEILLELAIKGEECTKLQQNVETSHLLVLEIGTSLKEIREQLLTQKDVDYAQIEQLNTSIRKSFSLNPADRSQWKSSSTVHQVDSKDNDKDDSDELIMSLEDFDSSDISDLPSKSQLLECQKNLDVKIQECHSLKDEINNLQKAVEIKTKECSSLKMKLESFESVSEVSFNPIVVSQQNSSESDPEPERLKHGSGELVEDENLQMQNNLDQLNSVAKDCTLDKQEYDCLKQELLSNKAELEAKRQQCEDLVEQLDQMKLKFSDYDTQKSKEIEALQSSLERLESKALEYDVLVEEIGRSKGESKEEADIILLKSELTHKTKELNALKEKHRLLFKSSETKIQNFATLEKEIEKFNICLLDAEQEEQLSADVHLQSPKQEIHDGLELNLSNSEHIDNIQPKSSDIDEDDIIELRKELKSKLTHITELKRDNSNLKDSLERLTAENAGFINLDSKLNLCQKELQSKVDECHNLAAKLDLRSQESEMIKKLEENVSAKSQECLFLTKELSLLKERKMDENERLTELPELKESEMDERLKEIEEKLSAKSQECLLHSKELSELEGRNMELNETVKELEEKLSEKSQEYLAVSDELSEHKERRIEENKRAKELEEKLSDKSQECLALTKVLSELKEGKMEESITIKELEEKLSEKSEECSVLSKELSELKEGKKEESEIVKELEAKLSDKSQECLVLSEELEQLKERKVEEREIVKELEEKLSDKSQECLALTKVLSELKEGKMEESITMKELEEKLSEKSEECSVLSKELSELKEGKEEEREIVKELEKKLSEKLEECSAHSRELPELEESERVKDLEEILSEKSQECLALSEELAQLKERKVEESEIVKELEEKLSDKSQECLALNKVLSELKEGKMEEGKTVKELEEKLSEKSEECSALSKELSERKMEESVTIKELEEKLSEKSQECSALSKELSERKIEESVTIKELEEKLSEKSQECLALSRELSELKERKIEESELVKELEEKLSDKSQECLALTKVLSELKEGKMEEGVTVKELEDKLSEMSQKCSSLSNELAELKEGKMEESKTVKELEEKLSDKLQERLAHSRELSELKERKMKEDEIVKELEEKLSDKSQECLALTQILSELKEGKRELNEIVKELENKLSEKSDECLAHSRELSELRERKIEESERVKKLEEKLSEKSQECLAHSKELFELKERKMEEGEIMKELEEKLSDKSQECLALTKVLAELKESRMEEGKTVKELEEKLSEKSQECSVHSKELSELKERKIEESEIVKELEEKLSDKSQECLALTKVLSELEEGKMEESKTVKELEEKLSDKLQECLAHSKELSELKERKIEESEIVKELEEKLSEKSEECLAHSRELSALEGRNSDINMMVKELEEKLSEKSQECSTHSRELSELKAGKMETEKMSACELEQKDKEQIKLSNELAALKQDKENQINALEKELVVKTQQYNSLSKNLDSLEITHAGIQFDLRKELEEKCRLYEYQSNELDTIHQKHSRLQGSLLELKSDIAKKYNEIKDKDLEIEELRHQISYLQSQLSKKDQLCVTPGTSNESMNKESSTLKEEISNNNSAIQKPNTSGVYDESTDVQSLLKEKVEECSILKDKLEDVQKDVQQKTQMLIKMKREKLVQSELIEEYEVKAEMAEYFRKELENQMNKTSCLEEQLEKQKEMCTIPSDSHGSSRSNIQQCSDCVALAAQVKETEQKQCHVITCLQTEIKNCTSKIEELSNENGSYKELIQKLEAEISEKKDCIANMESKLVKGAETGEVEDMKKQLSNNFMSLARAEATNKVTKLHFSKLEDSYKETITILENKIKYLQEELRLAQVNSNENTISIKNEVPSKPSTAWESNVIPSRGFVDQLAIVTLEADKAKLNRKIETMKQKLINSLKNNEELKKELSAHKNVSSTKKLAVVNKSTDTEICEAAESPVSIKPPSTPSRSIKDDCKNQ